MRPALLCAAPLLFVTASARAADAPADSGVYVRLEGGATANAAFYERTDMATGPRVTSSARARLYGTEARAQIGYAIVPRLVLAATVAIDYASISPSFQGVGDARATFGSSYTQTSEALEVAWFPAGGLRVGAAFGWTTVALSSLDPDSFTEDLDTTLNGPYGGFVLGYDLRVTRFAWVGLAARADFAHVTDDRPDGHSSMTTFSPGLSAAITFR